jgi:hypothetical protein
MPPTPERPTALTAIAIWHLLVAACFALGVLMLLMLMLIVWIQDPGREAFIASLFFMLATLGVATVGVAFAAVGLGLLRGKPWSRPGALVLAALQLPLFPIGTAAGGLTLFWLLRREEAPTPVEPATV